MPSLQNQCVSGRTGMILHVIAQSGTDDLIISILTLSGDGFRSQTFPPNLRQMLQLSDPVSSILFEFRDSNMWKHNLLFTYSLNPRTLNEHEEQLFCNVCYEKIFNPADFTVENYGGVITPEDIERYTSIMSRMIIFVNLSRHLNKKENGRFGRIEENFSQVQQV